MDGKVEIRAALSDDKRAIIVRMFTEGQLAGSASFDPQEADDHIAAMMRLREQVASDFPAKWDAW